MRSEDEDQPVSETTNDEPEAGLEPEPAPADAAVPEVRASIADGQRQRLDPSALKLARMTGRITIPLVLSGMFVALLMVTLLAPLSGVLPAVLFSVWLVLAIAAVALVETWPGIHHRHIWYRVDDYGMTIWRGVIWRQVISVPRTRVQHIDVVQGPLQRGFDLATLVMHTAGTQDSSVSLGGLPHSAALAIRDFLIDEHGFDGV